MKLIYIAGPYAGLSNWAVSRNIEQARTAGLTIARTGVAWPIVPHTMSGLEYYGAVSEEFATAGCLELVGRADALLLLPGWEVSAGARKERARAQRLGKPIFVAVSVPCTTERLDAVYETGDSCRTLLEYLQE